MKIETMNYKKKAGWSRPQFPDLDSERTLILTFYAPFYFDFHEPFNTLRDKYPNAKMAGCSTSGEILNEQINDESISVAILRFENSDVKITTQPIKENSESYDVGKKIAEELNSDELRSILVLSDGLNVNGTSLVEGLKSALSSHVIVTGGLAGDGKDFKKTSVLKEGIPATHQITGIGFYGDNIDVTFGSKGGWDIFGPERLITRSKDNVLYEIDGEPALALYKKYLGDRAAGLPATALLFPLAISEKAFSDQVVRTILSVNEEEQSMTFAGNIPQGWYGQFMKANFERLIEGAASAGEAALKNKRSNNERLAIAISCVGRRLILGERSEEEIDATLESLGGKTPMIGFYSYGEISPSGLSTCDLHNQTMTLTTITER